ncbi:MAG: peptidoglycan recognition family protein [Synechococcaceae cyanobacterium]|nr:peptidoglycan recognition family protein [Synechococcaceae cyanobacterium]
MNSRVQPLVWAMAGAALVSLGALGWLARELLGNGSGRADARPSLLDLLEDVGRPGGGNRPVPPRRPAPPPPAPLRWSSPLAQACPASDPQLSHRLSAALANLPRLRQRVAIDPSNFGDRFRQDAFGNPVDPTPRVVVLHETVYSLGSALNTFKTPHPRDEDQVSYHTLVGQRGEIVEVVPPEQRAFGAGNSAFNGQWVVTNPSVGGSINNFALHLSLESPADGEDQEPQHSGYTGAQYDAAALVVADWMRRFRIPPQAITTHRHVDLGGERADPRSFDWRELETRLAALGMLC